MINHACQLFGPWWSPQRLKAEGLMVTETSSSQSSAQDRVHCVSFHPTSQRIWLCMQGWKSNAVRPSCSGHNVTRRHLSVPAREQSKEAKAPVIVPVAVSFPVPPSFFLPFPFSFSFLLPFSLPLSAVPLPLSFSVPVPFAVPVTGWRAA